MKIIIVVLVLLLIVDFIVENFVIVRKRCVDFGGDIKIMHVSDVHKVEKGKNNCKITEMAEKMSPDLIFITGDVVSRTQTDFGAVEVMLEKLCGVADVYMVNGNHEQSIEKNAEFQEMMSRTDVKILENECRQVEIKGRMLNICGVQQEYSTYKKDDGYKNLDVFTAGDMRNAIGKKPDGFVLLLAHNPLWAEIYSEWGADFTFSGHVHGGILRLFGIGILSPERKLFPEYSKGVYEIGKNKICVSGGIGKIRLFNPPEIVFYDL